ncbi:MAG: 30S ribosomal protein S16 [Elusimicrobia bacterium]|nr:30S ribosomal protein S16 [Elusimicrobiota bacterium]
MAVVIRLQRIGKPKQPYYRVVAIEKSRGAVGRPIEILGSYNPRVEKGVEKVQFNAERYAHWIKVGAKPSETVATLLKGRVAVEKSPAGAKP